MIESMSYLDKTVPLETCHVRGKAPFSGAGDVGGNAKPWRRNTWDLESYVGRAERGYGISGANDHPENTVFAGWGAVVRLRYLHIQVM